MKKQWFYAQDTRQISKRKKFLQYVLDNRKWTSAAVRRPTVRCLDLLERLYPKLEGQSDLIRTVVNIYRQIQQEAFGIVLINRQNQVRNTTINRLSFVENDSFSSIQVFLVQNEKYYWSFPKGKLKLNPETYRYESQWSCALREVSDGTKTERNEGRRQLDI